MSEEKIDNRGGCLFRFLMCQRDDTKEKLYGKVTREQTRKSKTIDQEIEKEREVDNPHKVLLLGGQGSGKSTLFKQMRILHCDGFSQTDYINFRYLIHANTMEAMSQLIEGAYHLRIRVDLSVLFLVEWYRKEYSPTDSELTCTMAETIKMIYASPFIQQVLRRKDEIELLDSAIYFLDNLERIAAPKYQPTSQDVLRSRITTTGIIEIQFNHKDHILKMVDVGGQRTEQRKWIHCFDKVSGVLFVAELSAYNMRTKDLYYFDGTQTSHADPNTKYNKLKDSMRIFKRIANHPAFSQNTAMILFLNKVDIFQEKLTRQNLDVCFSEYKGPAEFVQAVEYVRMRFEKLVSAELQLTRPTYVHFTTATDTKNIDRVFDSCLDVVFKRNMERVGLGA